MSDCLGGWLGAHLLSDCTDLSWEQRLAWRILTNAIENSLLTTDPERVKMRGTPESLSLLIESRRWLLEDGYQQGGITRDMCISLLSLNKIALFDVLRHLWQLWDNDVATTIREAVKRYREAIEREKQAQAKKTKYRRGRPAGSYYKNYTLALEAAKTRDETMDTLMAWRGVTP